jgi:hypothetical protein
MVVLICYASMIFVNRSRNHCTPLEINKNYIKNSNIFDLRRSHALAKCDVENVNYYFNEPLGGRLQSKEETMRGPNAN